MSGTPRESGWGLHEKATRYRQAEEARRIVKPDANQAFVFTRPKQKQPQQYGQPTTPAPAASPTTPAPAPAASPVAAPAAQTPTPQQQQQQSQQYAPAEPADTWEEEGTDDMADPKYPGASPAHARESVAPSGPPPVVTTPVAAAAAPAAVPSRSPSNQNLLCSCLVELFEMVGQNPVPKAYGPKGVTLLRMPNSAAQAEGSSAVPYLFQLLVYAPVSKKAEFSVDVSAGFTFTLLPDRFATFEDADTRRSWCLKFGASEDAYAMARSFALIAEMRASAAYAAARASGANVPPRSILVQELAVGAPDTPALNIGDQMKVRYNVSVLEASNPFAASDTASRLTKIYSSPRDSSLKFMLGDGLLLSTGVEELLVGMRKKGVRLLIIPSELSRDINQRAEWGPHVKPDSTLVVEVTVTGVRNSIPVHGEGGGETHMAAAEETTDQAGETGQGHTDEQAAEEDAGAAAGGVYNPVTVPAGATDLRSRMAALSSASMTNGVGAAAAAASPAAITPVSVPAGRRVSLTLGRASSRSSSPRGSPQSATEGSSGAASSSAGPTIESLLSDLNLSDLLPNFVKEGVGYSDLLMLDAEDLRAIVPQIGPRRRISGRIQEIQQQRASAPTVATTTPTAAAASAINAAAHAFPLASPPSASATGASSGSAGGSAAIPPVHPVSVISPYRQRLASGADQRAPPTSAAAASESLFSPNPATPVTPVTGVAAKYAAAAAASSGQQQPQQHPPAAQSSSSHRSRTFSDHDDSFLSAVPARSSGGLPTTQAALDALLAAEYERGKADTVALARDKIADMRETAQTRFASLTAQLEQAEQRNANDRDKAREAVQQLRQELRAAQQSLAQVQSEKEVLTEKSQKYVQQLKDKLANASESQRAESAAASADQFRLALERVFTGIRERVKPKDLYEGDEVMSLVRAVLKNMSAEGH